MSRHADPPFFGNSPFATITVSTIHQLPSANYQLPTDFGSGRSEVVDHVENHIWDHPLGFIVMAVALILVWILRKRRGLI